MHFGSETSRPISLWSLFWLCFKLGSTAFGGFMALISVFESLIVKQRQLLTHEDMLNGISLVSVLPGPLAINLVAYVGYRLRGGLGAFVSMTGVILPSFLVVTGLTIIYLRVGEIAAVNQAFLGFTPAVVAIILNAVWRMSQRTIKSWRELMIALLAIVGLNLVKGFGGTLAVVVGAGIMGSIWLPSPQQTQCVQPQQLSDSKLQLPIILKMINALLLLLGVTLVSLWLLPYLPETSLTKILFTCSSMSLTLFGGGYVFIPLIQEVMVDNYGWVTETQFVNAIAIGQITPGPVLISVAFIGYVIKGILGAAAATIGIFSPPALLTVICSHLLEQINQSRVVQAALRGIRPAVIGMILTAALVIAKTAAIHWATLVIFSLAMLALWRLRLVVVLVIPIAGILGILLY
ncbi:MAG: chromate efflux transporter [Cyanothece sp. SIO1E1]|nr:chromate efflux transporter [Cyanothece sp. SIO1E1]